MSTHNLSTPATAMADAERVAPHHRRDVPTDKASTANPDRYPGGTHRESRA